jgi:tetratricopeptide (TPR) repeat protein
VRGPARVAALALAAVLAGAVLARAEWLQPDPSYKEAVQAVRAAQKDTVGHGADPGRLDSLGVAQLRLGRVDDAARLFRRVLDLAPGDAAACAALGKLALFADRADEAESLLAPVAATNDDARLDLFSLRLRRGEYGPAAEMADSAGQGGREPMLRELAEGGAYLGGDLTAEVRVPFVKTWPVPIVRAKVNGLSVLLAIDTGIPDLLLDDSAVRRCGLRPIAGESALDWSGTRVAVRHALVQRFEIGGARLERVPAAIRDLRRYSLDINPQFEPIFGIIGVNVLRRFAPTFDFVAQRLVLRHAGTAVVTPAAQRVPFELWGESEITVRGSIAGGRKLAMWLTLGLPASGAGAPAEVFEEFGIKPGAGAGLAKGGTWLSGAAWLGVTVPTLTIGTLVRDRVPGWSGAMDSEELWRHGVRRDALLAADFFRGRRLTIDWQARQLLVETPAR